MTKLKKTMMFASVLCVLSTAITSAESQVRNQEPNQPDYLKTTPPDKLKEDLDFLLKTIKEVHVNMYAYTSKEEFDPTWGRLYESINRPMNRLQFYKLVAPVVASLKNGHTFMQPPFTFFQDYALKGGKYFPLEMRIEESHVILSNYTGPYDLPVGAEVLIIDDQKASNFLCRTAKYSPSEGRAYNLAMLQRESMLPFYLWLEKGDENSLSLEVKTSNGQVKTYNIQAVDFEEIKNYQKKKADKHESKTKSTSKPESRWYSYRHIAEYNASLIEFNMFHNMQEFKKFLKRAFREIREQKVSNLIIDIRENPGGSSNLGDELLKYLTDEPFRQFEQIKIRISHQLFKTQPGLKQVYPDAAIGSTVTMEGQFIKPENNPLKFRGRAFVLIGPKSASSSVSFASAVKYFHIGTLIGQETIDTPVNYGDCIYDVLPNSGLRFSVACKCFVDAGGKPDGRGIIPDYEVHQKPEDTAKGVDTVLEITLDLIGHGGTMSSIQSIN